MTAEQQCQHSLHPASDRLHCSKLLQRRAVKVHIKAHARRVLGVRMTP